MTPTLASTTTTAVGFQTALIWQRWNLYHQQATWLSMTKVRISILKSTENTLAIFKTYFDLLRLLWAVWPTKTTKRFLPHQTNSRPGTIFGLLWHGGWRRLDSVSETSTWKSGLQQVFQQRKCGQIRSFKTLAVIQASDLTVGVVTAFHTRSNVDLILILETGWTTETALVTLNCGMMSFGWAMSTCTPCSHKVRND